MEVIKVRLAAVIRNGEGRPVNPKTIKKLAESMDRFGQLNPILVYPQSYCSPGVLDNAGYALIAGSHRYEAAKLLGWEEMDAYVIDTTDGWHHKLLEITENLHREDLTAQERAKLTSIWVEHVKDLSGQVGPKGPVGHRPEGGLNDAARQLGINRKEVQRAVKIAGLSQEAQDAAVELGLDDNQDALLEAARYDDPGDQVDVLKERAAKPKRKKKEPPTPSQVTDKIIKLLKSIRTDRLALTEVLTNIQLMLKE